MQVSFSRWVASGMEIQVEHEGVITQVVVPKDVLSEAFSVWPEGAREYLGPVMAAVRGKIQFPAVDLRAAGSAVKLLRTPVSAVPTPDDLLGKRVVELDVALTPPLVLRGQCVILRSNP